MAEISDLKLFQATILDSFAEKKYVSSAPPQDSEEGKDLKGKDPEGKGPEVEEKDFKGKAKEFARNHWKTGAALAVGFVLGPPIIAGVVGLLGFGSTGIAAGSIAAWMMSLEGGAVAAGGLVATLQSIGAAGFGLGGVLLTGTLGAAVTSAVLKKLEANPEGLKELEEFVTIKDDTTDTKELEGFVTIKDDTSDTTTTSDKSVSTKLTFDMHHKLLSNEEVLKTFFQGFDVALKFATLKRFEFLVVRDDEACEKGCNALSEHLKEKHGNDHVKTLEEKCLILDLSN